MSQSFQGLDLDLGHDQGQGQHHDQDHMVTNTWDVTEIVQEEFCLRPSSALVETMFILVPGTARDMASV